MDKHYVYPLRNVPPDHGSLGLAIRRADDRILNGYDNGIMVCVYCTQVSYVDRWYVEMAQFMSPNPPKTIKTAYHIFIYFLVQTFIS